MSKGMSFIFGVFLVTATSFAHAGNRGVSNTITGAPGNSSAAHGSLGDTNCVGDVMSYNARQQGGLGHSLSGAPHGAVPGLISSIVTLGSMIWGTGMDCADFIANQPPPPPPPPGDGGGGTPPPPPP